MITQRFHALFVALVDHHSVIITARCLDPHLLEFVRARRGTIPAAQHARKRRVRFVRWRFDTHDVPATIDIEPRVRVSIDA